jgi:hypothetical protein
MVGRSTDLTNTTYRSNNGYFRNQEIESMSCVQHIHNINTLNTLTKNYPLFLHPMAKNNSSLSSILADIDTDTNKKKEFTKMFSVFFDDDDILNEI